MRNFNKTTLGQDG